MGDPRTGERPPSPSECLQWFNPRAHNSLRPVTTGDQELMGFFKALVIYQDNMLLPDQNDCSIGFEYFLDNKIKLMTYGYNIDDYGFISVI